MTNIVLTDYNDKTNIVPTGYNDKTTLVDWDKAWGYDSEWIDNVNFTLLSIYNYITTKMDLSWIQDDITDLENNKLDSNWELRTWLWTHKLIYTNSSGNEVELSFWTNGQVLWFTWISSAPTPVTPTMDIHSLTEITTVDWDNDELVIYSNSVSWNRKIIAWATETKAWLVELATNEETLTWTDTEKSVTPAWLSYAMSDWWYDYIYNLFFLSGWSLTLPQWATWYDNIDAYWSNISWIIETTDANAYIYSTVAWKTGTSNTYLRWDDIDILEIEFRIIALWDNAWFIIWISDDYRALYNNTRTDNKIVMEYLDSINITLNTANWTTITSSSSITGLSDWVDKFNIIYDKTGWNAYLYKNWTLEATITTTLPSWTSNILIWIWNPATADSIWYDEFKVKVKYA